MHNTRFATVDADRHTEEWTYMTPDGKSHVVARFDLRRKRASKQTGWSEWIVSGMKAGLFIASFETAWWR